MTAFLRTLLAVTALAAGSTPALGQGERDTCRARIDAGRVVGVRDYDPFSVARTEIPIDVEISNRGGAACNALLNAVGDTARRILRGPAALDYEILSENGDLIRVGEAAGFGLPVTLPANRATTLRLLLRIPTGQVSPPGFYADLIKLELREANGRELDASRLALLVRVEPRAQINIAGTSAAFGSGPALQTVDFGVLESGAERRAFLQLRSNTQVRVSLSSQNRGTLANASLGAGARIPYQLTIDGEAIALDTGRDTIARRPGRTLDGQSYPMTFRVPLVQSYFAGRYSDVISIDIIPQE